MREVRVSLVRREDLSYSAFIGRGTLGARSISVRVRPGPGLQTPSGVFCRFHGSFIDCEKEPASVDPGAELRGQAARLDEPVMPQLGLALVAVTAVGVQF